MLSHEIVFWHIDFDRVILKGDIVGDPSVSDMHLEYITVACVARRIWMIHKVVVLGELRHGIPEEDIVLQIRLLEISKNWLEIKHGKTIGGRKRHVAKIRVVSPMAGFFFRSCIAWNYLSRSEWARHDYKQLGIGPDRNCSR